MDETRDKQKGTENPVPPEQGTGKTREEVLQEKDDARLKREERILRDQKELMSRNQLEYARRAGNVLTAKVIGAEVIRIGDTDRVAAAVMLKGRIKASIPFEEMYTSQVLDMSTVNLETEEGRKQYQARQRQMLAKVIGLHLSLVIKDIIPDPERQGHDLILCSRREASERLCRKFFRPGSSECREGETYQATVLSVSPHSLAASFKGIDFVIQQNSLTNRYLLDLQSHYAPGDRIPFVLENLNRDGVKVTFRANTIAAELAEMKSRWYMVSAGTVAKAVITHVRRRSPNSRVDIYAYLPDYDFACKISHMSANDFGRQIVSGDEVQIVVTGFRDSGYLDARLRSLHGNAGLFTHY